MSKFVCNCGHVISDVDYPSSVNGAIFTERAIETLIAASGKELADLLNNSGENRQDWVKSRFGDDYPADASDVEVFEDLMSQQIRFLSHSVVRCDSCGRLYVQTEPGSNDYKSFVPERNRSPTADE